MIVFFLAAIFSPAQYGASFKASVNDAPALQRAIDAAAAAGGGTVVIPAGRTLMSGAIELKSRVTLDLEPGARLLGSTRQADYPHAVFISARHADDVAITGTGTIDGQGLHFLGPEGPEIYQRTATDWRPRLILFEACHRVHVTDVNLQNAGFWTLHLAGCEDVSIHGISIRNSLKAPNCDGIDPDHSRNVRIEDCSVECGDDAIVVKTSAEFAQYGPCDGIVITGCSLTTHDCALKIGSETVDAIRNVVFSDCVVNQCGRGVGIIARDQGDVENIVAHDIVIRSQLFYPEWWGASEPIYVDSHPRNPGGKTGRIRGLHFSHIYSQSEGGVFLQGCPECIPEDIVLDDVRLDIAKTTKWPSRIDLRPPEQLGVEEKGVVIAGFHLQDVRGVTLRNCSVRWGANPPASYGPAIQQTRVADLHVEGFAGGDAHADPAVDPSPAAWPHAEQTMRPWTRWWWLGSGVDRPNLERMLTQFSQEGLGGVEICPIYGAKGYEKKFIPYLSPEWMDMLAYTMSTARRLGLGVDLTTGTGWPMGGPWITKDHASEGMKIEHGPSGYALAFKQPVQRVKRAAPGGEGYVIDPFSTAALDQYLGRFSQAFDDFGEVRPRAQFHDSFEYFGATWTPDFPAQFSRRRGYDLMAHLDALAGAGDPDVSARVREDYRRTIGELHLDWVRHWTAWSHGLGSMTREQAHGAPANIEDVYAAADIPETEGSFGGGAEDQIPMMKLASSAAHVQGKRLASSETFTWLGEHFNVTLAQLKPVVDRFFLAGINHIFFHGTPYSPSDAPWPGWLFYASVNFGPEGGIWHDLPAFNAFATRCESILQRGRPDNDVLVYFPVADYWQAPKVTDERDSGTLLIPFRTPGTWMQGTPFHDLTMEFWRKGYDYDEVTDDLLAGAGADAGSIWMGGNRYGAVVVPACRYIPVATMERLIALARSGGTVIFAGAPPSDVPGFHDFEARQTHLRELVASLHLAPSGRTAVGAGAIYVGSGANLEVAGLRRERMTDQGLHFLRRARENGTDYYIVNGGKTPIDGWVPLARRAESAEMLDPLSASPGGRPALRTVDGQTQAYLQLPPDGSVFLRLYSECAAAVEESPAWIYRRPASSPMARAIQGNWSVHFLEGGPVLPKDFVSSGQPQAWTGRGDPDADRFAGTARYQVEFQAQPDQAADWSLTLEHVAESAQVRINDQAVATLWCPPYRALVGKYLRPGRNVLEIDVTNVAANRVRDLDRRHVQWKSFYEINFVNLDYQPFDASNWPVRPSGLLGPVTLAPVETFTPAP